MTEDLIFYISIERHRIEINSETLGINNCIHIPVQIYSNISALRFLQEWYTVNKVIQELSLKYKIEVLILRGAPTAIFAYKLVRKNIPFVVESFEPHSDYQIQSGNWQNWGIKSIIQKRIEKFTLNNAKEIHVLTSKYCEALEKVDPVVRQKIKIVPCHVQLEKVYFSTHKRIESRIKLGYNNSKVGIYVGKFGGIYYDDLAFKVFLKAYILNRSTFELVILTPSNPKVVYSKVQKMGIPRSKVFVRRAPHEEVPNYLSAADYAWSFHRKGPSKIALSPIKHGEYWACGLPILMPPGIGDDSEILVKENGGAIFDPDNLSTLETAFNRIDEILDEKDHRERIRQIALKYRNPEIQKKVYKKLIEKIA